MRANVVFAGIVAASFLGLDTPDVHATGRVKITFTTSPAGGQYAPNHVVAVWIESAGTFVRTIGRWSQTRTSSLVTWIGKAGAGDVDAVSGATQTTQPDTLTAEWYLRDKLGAIVPDGTYTIRLELADFNPGQGTPNLGTFTFIKGTAPQIQTALANGGFSNVSIDFDPTVSECGNNAVDPGEQCDPMITSGTGACVASCPAPADACMPSVIQGSAATCDASCVVQPITACASGDGCCPDGCDGQDDDCGGGNGTGNGNGTGGGNGSDTELSGGCSSSSDAAGLVLAGLGLGFVVFAKRRRKRCCA